MADLILQYRARYPNDAYLRYWCGMILAHKGRHGLATAEFAASLGPGGPTARARRRLAASRSAAQADSRAGSAGR